ncbi:MAG: ATP-binding protein [Desulfovibrio sp.]
MNLQSYYDTVMQLSHGIVVTLDLDGSIIHGNSMLESLTGFSMKELAGRDWFKTFIAKGCRQKARQEIISKAFESGISTMSGSITTRSGEKVYIDWNLKPLVDSTKEIISILCVGQDVTHHRLHQKSLMQERFTLLERNKELNCLFRLSALMGDIDQELEEILNKAVQILPSAFQNPDKTHASISIDHSQFTSANFIATPHMLEEPLMINKERRGFLRVAVETDMNEEIKNPVFIEDEKSLLSTAAHQVALLIAKKEGKAAKKNLEAQLRQADRLAKIGQFSAGLAHEINEPLANILGFAQLALQTPELPDQVESDLNNIVDSSLHAREIIRKLMFFSRQMPPQFVATNLNETITQALRITEAGARRENVNVVCDFDESIPIIMADPQHIKQVIVNLAANSIHAMDNTGGTLTITTLNNKNDAYIILEDTGPGIAADELKQIFNPFFTTKDVDKGTGLGLSVVHGIVKAHEGFIQVHSELGKGTRVEIAFPCQQQGEFEDNSDAI